MIRLTRRAFLSTGGLLGFLGLDLKPTKAYAGEKSKKLEVGKLTTSICPYCAVGCSALVTSIEEDGKRRVINSEGDPDHPINEGALCPKGASIYQMANNPKRLTKVLYRAPGSTRFEEKDWGWAAQAIAKRIKKTRDESFTGQNAKGQTVNRWPTTAFLAASASSNETGYVFHKVIRALGGVAFDNQARV